MSAKSRTSNLQRRIAVLCAALMLGMMGFAQQAANPTKPKAATQKKTSAPNAPSKARAARAPAQKTAASAKPAAAHDVLDDHVDAARTFQLAGDFDSAASEYRQTVGVCLQRIGNLRISEGDFTRGIHLLEDATAADPKNNDIAVDLGIGYFYAGDFEKSKAQVESALKRDAGNTRAMNLLGKVLFVQGRYDEAAQQLQEAVTRDPDFDLAYVLALAHLKNNKPANAAVLFDEMRATLKNTPELHMLLGRAYQATGYVDMAESEFLKALALDPKCPRANFLIGVLDVLRNKPEKYADAGAHFRAEIAISPRDYSSHYLLGAVQLGEHQVAEAEVSLKEAARLEEKNPDPWFYLGQLYSQQGRLDEAVAALKKCIALTTDPSRNDSQVVRAHYMLGQGLQKLGKVEEGAAEIATSNQLRATHPPTVMQSMGAPGLLEQLSAQLAQFGEQSLRAMLTQRPSAAVDDKSKAAYVARLAEFLGNSYHNLGVIDARAGRYPEAAAEFKHASEWLPTIDTLDRNWGIAAFRSKEYADAIGPLSRQVRRTPGDMMIRQMLALSYFLTDDFPRSAEAFRLIIDQLPDDANLLYFAGTAFVRSGNAAAGSAVFSRLLRHADKPEVHLLLGQAHAQQEEYPEALQEFQEALKLNPSLPEAHYYSGMVHFQKGRLEEAVAEFQAELGINPKSVPAIYQIAYVRLTNHELEEGMKLLDQVLALDPSYADAYYQRGKALLEKGDIKPAIESLQKAVSLDPSADYAYLQLSLAYRRDGRAADAQQAMQQYEKIKTERAPQRVKK